MSRVSLIAFALAACCATTARADAPIFSQSSYSFSASLAQQTPYIGTVQALDPEWDDFVYILHDTSGKFSIDPFHGYIVANFAELSVGTYTMQVEAIDIFDEWSIVDVQVTVYATPPPVIANCTCYNYGGGMWLIGGTVISGTPTGTIRFGGLLNGKSTVYYPNGTFMYMTQVYGTGSISIQAIDANGLQSPVVYRHIGN